MTTTTAPKTLRADKVKVCDLSLAPRGLVPLPAGQFAARTATGVAVMSPSHATRKQTLLPVLHSVPCAVVSFDPEANNAVWITVEANGRVVVNRTLTASKEVLCVVPGAVAVYCVNTFVVVALATGDVRFFTIAPGLLRPSEDCAVEAEDLGSAAATPDSIGMALSTAAADEHASVALFAQNGTELTFDVITLSRGAPATVSWRGSAQLPDDDPPVNWAVTSSGEAVSVVPKAGSAPIIVTATSGRASSIDIAPATYRVRDVVDTAGGNGFAFVSRVASSSEQLCVHTFATHPHVGLVSALVLDSLAGLPKSAGLTLAAPYSRSADSAIGVLAGRGFYTVQMTCATPAQQSSGASPSAAIERGTTTGSGAQPAAPAPAASGTVVTLASLLSAAAQRKTATSAAASASDQTEAIIAAARTGKWNTVVGIIRDPGLTHEATHHAVVDALVSDAEPTALLSYLRHCRDLAATTVLYALAAASRRAAGADASPSKGRKSQTQRPTDGAKPQTTTSASLSWAAAIVTGAIEGSSGSSRIQGALHEAWRGMPWLHQDAAAGVFRHAYGVALHALSTGRLPAFELSVRIMDAVVVCNAAELQRDCATELSRAHALVDAVGKWATAEPGMRLGQLTAHSGPALTATKEAQVVPDLAYRIPTATTIAVHRERYLV